MANYKLSFKRAKEENDWELMLSIEKQFANSKTYFAFTKLEDLKAFLGKEISYLVFLNNQPVGEAAYELKDNGKKAYISTLVVIPEQQGKGIATGIFNKILREIIDKPAVENVELITHPRNNAALVIYLKNGFEIIEWQDNPFGDGEPRLKLRKKLF
ncbi:hypothetical protein A2W32_04985 [candidate division WWE3 bacterium RBG_16_37_10]|uniref:N-acetyltransferase domain-containing protein n=1 Tax=candidate division WWE3 bacterium RBG_16_37_10 TaxID=1802610 RepID=A0A1F4UXN9_UNCKA|nr:MAG: hypothetical protein A2W32_04985 [candidate division WWE3 bacterium RBG_16_37_10]